MIKKFLKAMWIGIRESCIIITIVYLIRIVYMPLLLGLIWKIFKINLTVYHSIIFMIFFIIGPAIWDAIWHCSDVLKYAERNGCSLKEAWYATSIDYYDYDFDD